MTDVREDIVICRWKYNDKWNSPSASPYNLLLLEGGKWMWVNNDTFTIHTGPYSISISLINSENFVYSILHNDYGQPDEWYNGYGPETNVADEPKQHQCNCDLYEMMRRGCTCGGV